MGSRARQQVFQPAWSRIGNPCSTYVQECNTQCHSPLRCPPVQHGAVPDPNIRHEPAALLAVPGHLAEVWQRE